MIRRMQRLYILYTQADQDALIHELQRLGVLHLEASALGRSEAGPLNRADYAQERSRVENLLLEARGILDLFAEVEPQAQESAAAPLPSELDKYPQRLEDHYEEYQAQLAELGGQVREHVTRRRELRERLASVERFQEVLQASGPLLEALGPDAEVVAVICGPRDRPVLEEVTRTLRERLPGTGPGVQRVQAELTEDRLEVLLAVPPEYAQAVRTYLSEKGLRGLTLPPHVPKELGFREGLRYMEEEWQTLPGRLEATEAALRRLSEQWSARLKRLVWGLEDRLAQLEALAQGEYTAYSVLLGGWVPEDELPALKDHLEARFPGIVIRASARRWDEAQIPVALANNRWSRPYEVLLSIVPLPKYGTADPTPAISLFFPVFFGIMVGDFGYGALMVALALWFKRRFGPRGELIDSAATVFLHAAGASVLFGLVFGEAFGLTAPWPHLSRFEHRIPFMIFAIVVGVVQVFLGLLLGALISWRHGQRKHFVERATMPFVVLALGLAFGTWKLGLPQSLLTPSVIVLIVGIPLLLYGGGFIGVLEILSRVSNVLSYVRIMAIGIASLKLAETANELGGMMGNVVVGVLVAIIFHTLAFVLAIFDPGIQSVRLHYVEFFRQFYEGGGKPYQPFKSITAEPERRIPS